MSLDPSSFTDTSLLPAGALSSNISLHHLMTSCFRSEKGILVFSTVFIVNVLLLPLFCLILYLGYHQWRKQRNVPTAAKMSHSDLFIYHSIAMQLKEFVGFTLFFCGGYTDVQNTMMGGLSILSVTSLGEALFHLLTCVERYIAVVHPIVYRELRQTKAIKMRNIGIGCIWLLCFGCMSIFISVLHALKRPGPGEVCGKRVRIDKSKQRAFHTITAILGVLLFRFVGNLVCNVIEGSVVQKSINLCLVFFSAFWFYLPSSVALPLLFLLRAGKLQCR